MNVRAHYGIERCICDVRHGCVMGCPGQANPCVGHACKQNDYPHLEFEYDQKGGLTCYCTKPCPQVLKRKH
jgi:hypothetical protein